VACIIKPFTVVINSLMSKGSVLCKPRKKLMTNKKDTSLIQYVIYCSCNWLLLLCYHSWVATVRLPVSYTIDGTCIIKLFTAVINSIMEKGSVFVNSSKKWLIIRKKLASYTIEFITAVKGFMIQSQNTLADGPPW
jgi:hypothetical protein